MSGRRSCREIPHRLSIAKTRVAGICFHLATAPRVIPSARAICACNPGCALMRSMPMRILSMALAYHG